MAVTTYIHNSVARVITDSSLPNSAKTSVLKAELSGYDFGDTYINEVSSNISAQVKKYHSYGKDTYLRGLPSYFLSSASYGLAAVESAIQAENGHIPSLTNVLTGPPDPVLTALAYAQKHHSYVYNSTVGTVVEGFDIEGTGPHYLLAVRERILVQAGGINNDPADFTRDSPQSIVNPYIDNPMLGVDVLENIPLNSPDLAEGLFMYIGRQNGGQVNVLRVKIPDTEYDSTATYIQAWYTYTYALSEVEGIFSYKTGLGTYPELDQANNSYTSSNDFLPIAFFREHGIAIADINNKALIGDTALSDAQHASTTALLKKLKIDYTEVGERINAETSEDENGIEVNTNIQDVDSAVLVFGVALNSDTEEGVEYLFNFFNWFASVVGNNTVGTLRMVEGSYANVLTGKVDIRGRTTQVIGNIGESTFTSYGNHDYLLVRQVTATQCETIYLTSWTSKFQTLAREVTLSPDENEATILIPIHLELIKDLKVKSKERLLAQAMHFSFNSSYTVSTKWYQTKSFGIFVAIIAVILSVVSFGTSLAYLGPIVAGTGLVGIPLLITTILLAAAVQVAVGEVLELVAEELGADATYALAVLALIYAHKIPSSPETFTGLIASQVASGLVPAADAEIGRRLEDIQESMEEARELYDLKEEELNDLKESLETENYAHLVVNGYKVPDIKLGESFDSMYARTIGTPNPGSAAIEMITNYVDSKLALPKFTSPATYA